MSQITPLCLQYRNPFSDFYSHTTLNSSTKTSTFIHFVSISHICKSVTLHSLGDIKQRHSAKGKHFHQGSDLSAPCTPPPVNSLTQGPWHSRTHQKHGNTHDAVCWSCMNGKRIIESQVIIFPTWLGKRQLKLEGVGKSSEVFMCCTHRVEEHFECSCCDLSQHDIDKWRSRLS